MSCDIDTVDLQLVSEQLGLSQVSPSHLLLPQVSGVQPIEAMDVFSDIDIDMDVLVIDISDSIAADAFPDAIESRLSESLPIAATVATRAKALATPNQTFCVFIFFIPSLYELL